MSNTEAREYIERLRKDPIRFCKDVLGVELWGKQKEIIESVRDNPRTTVRSCSSGGKTKVAACCVLWFLSCFYPSTVFTTGRSFRQVRDQLWREIRMLHGRSKINIGGELTQTSLTLSPKWFAQGFTTDEPERILGFHNKFVLCIVDEASGIGDEVYAAIENTLSSGETHLLLLGNPTQNIGKFKESFSSPAYNQIHISAFDTPNLTGEGDFPFLISKNYVEDTKKEVGENSPFYEVFIKGNFPQGDTDYLIPFGEAENATQREYLPTKEDIVSAGVDIAREGEDESVIYVRQGNKIIHTKTWRKGKTEVAVTEIVNMIEKYHPKYVNVDEGYNPGVVDNLHQNKHNEVNGIKFGGSAKNSKYYANARAEMYFELAERFHNNTICIPKDNILLQQVTLIKPKPRNIRDQLVLQAKEEMKKSPDRADSLALAFYEPLEKSKNPIWFIETN